MSLLFSVLLFYIFQDLVPTITVIFVAIWLFIANGFYKIEVSDGAIRKSYFGITNWSFGFSEFYAEIVEYTIPGAPRGVAFVSYETGKTAETLPLYVFSDEDSDDLVTSLRAVGALRQDLG